MDGNDNGNGNGNAMDDTLAVTNGNSHEEAATHHVSSRGDGNNNQSKAADKETRRLRDDIESLQTQMANLKEMLKQSMEEKDQLQKERNELMMKYGEADEVIKKLKRQSAEESN